MTFPSAFNWLLDSVFDNKQLLSTKIGRRKITWKAVLPVTEHKSIEIIHQLLLHHAILKMTNSSQARITLSLLKRHRSIFVNKKTTSLHRLQSRGLRQTMRLINSVATFTKTTSCFVKALSKNNQCLSIS